MYRMIVIVMYIHTYIHKGHVVPTSADRTLSLSGFRSFCPRSGRLQGTILSTFYVTCADSDKYALQDRSSYISTRHGTDLDRFQAAGEVEDFEHATTQRPSHPPYSIQV